MFTDVDHKAARTAVHAALVQTQRDTRRSAVTVDLQDHVHGSHLGRTAAPRDTHITLSFEEIEMIVCYEFEEMYVRVGPVLLKQLIGVGIGGYGSAIVSKALCIYSERIWRSTLHDYQYLISGTRQVDDTTM